MAHGYPGIDHTLGGPLTRSSSAKHRPNTSASTQATSPKETPRAAFLGGGETVLAVAPYRLAPQPPETLSPTFQSLLQLYLLLPPYWYQDSCQENMRMRLSMALPPRRPASHRLHPGGENITHPSLLLRAWREGT